MTSDPKHDAKSARLRAAAARALEEAAARRESAAEVAHSSDETEIGGADGPEPTRFGDWEKKGRAYDF